MQEDKQISMSGLPKMGVATRLADAAENSNPKSYSAKELYEMGITEFPCLNPYSPKQD